MAKTVTSTYRHGQERADDRKYYSIAAMLFLFTALVFSRALFNDFIHCYDDDEYVARNPGIAGGISLATLKYILTAEVVANWHPVTMLSHALDIQLFGTNPGGHHLVSVLLHSANAALLFMLLRGATGATWRSAIVAALFAVHPLHVQPVAMIAQRKDMLSTLFLFLAFYTYAIRKQDDRLMLRTLLWLVLSLLSKPMAVTFPLLLLLVDYWPLKRYTNPDGTIVPSTAALLKAIVEKWTILLVVAAMSVIAFLVQRDAGATAPIDQLNFQYRIQNTIVAYVQYLVLTVWPSGLSAYYPYPQDFPLWKTLASLCILIGITALAFWNARRRPYFVVGWLWYVIGLIPVIGIVQVGTQAMADRYTYIPLIGVFVAVVWGIHEVVVAKPALRSVVSPTAVLVLLILTVRTWIEIGYWQNAETLWKRAIAVTTNNSTAHRGLQSIYFENEQWEEAVEQGFAAIQISPTPGHKQHVDAYLCLARSLQPLNREAEAIKVLQEAKSEYPKHEAIYFELASCYMALGNTQDAENAVRQMPSSPSTIEETLGNIYVNARNFDIAEQHYKEAIRIDPARATAYLHYAQCLNLMGKPSEAERMFTKAAELEPKIAERLRSSVISP